MPDFHAALALVLQYEGGKSDNPKDPGGRTNQGITQATFDAYNRAHGGIMRDVFAIVPAEVEAIYRERYADAIRFDNLPNGVGFCVFDAAVNSGPNRAAQWLQTALGVTADGKIGPATLAAARKASAFTVINTVCDERLAMMKRLSTWSTFGRGWASRVDDVRKSALAMARTSPALTVDTGKPVLASIENAINKAAAAQTPKPAPAIPSPGPVQVVVKAAVEPKKWWQFWRAA